MDCKAGLHRRIGVTADRNDALDKVGLLARDRQRIPAKLIGRCGNFEKRAAADQLCRDLLVGPVRYRWADAIGPGAAIDCARRGEWCSAELLSIEAERMLLRRV